jgi:hypothetical protein
MNGLVVEDGSQTVRMQCLPLYSLLKALNRTRGDFLSPDIEGPEYELLLTLPWDKVHVRTISVETAAGQLIQPEAVLVAVVSEFTHLTSLARDDLFVLMEQGSSSLK